MVVIKMGYLEITIGIFFIILSLGGFILEHSLYNTDWTSSLIFMFPVFVLGLIFIAFEERL